MKTFAKIIGVIFVIGFIGMMMEDKSDSTSQSNFDKALSENKNKQNNIPPIKPSLSSSQKEVIKKSKEEQEAKQKKEDKKLKNILKNTTSKVGDIFKKKDKGECVKFVSLYSAKYLAKEFGWSEMRVVREHKVNLWEKTSSQGKGRIVGEMRAGSNARLIDKSGNDYYVQSPLDKSKGWVSDVQVDKVVKLNPKTFKRCK